MSESSVQAAEAGAGAAAQADAGRGTPTRLSMFLQASAFDFVLVAVASVALLYTVSFAFWSAGSVRHDLALDAALVVPMILVMFAGSWSKRALVPAAAGAFALGIAMVAGGIALSPDGVEVFVDGALNDVDGNYSIFALEAAVVPVLVYLLSRRPVGLVVLSAAAMFACGLVQFLYRDFIVGDGGLVACMVVLVSCVALYAYQTYRSSMMSADRVKRTAFPGAFGFSVFAAAICVLAGLAIFFGIINGLGLTTPDIRPFERRAAQPIEEVAPSYDKREVDSDQQVNQKNDETENTSNEAEGDASGDTSDGDEDILETPLGTAWQAVSGYDAESDQRDMEEITYQILRLGRIIAAVVAVFLVILVVFLQRYRRKWRLRRIRNLPRGEQVALLYGFFMKRLRRLKIRKPDQLTPLEFAYGFEEALEPFSKHTDGVTFAEVTHIYMDARWGGAEVLKGDYDRCVEFYWAFFKNAREKVGWPRWVLYKYWRI